jgi:hypothetical protein
MYKKKSSLALLFIWMHRRKTREGVCPETSPPLEGDLTEDSLSLWERVGVRV